MLSIYGGHSTQHLRLLADWGRQMEATLRTRSLGRMEVRNVFINTTKPSNRNTLLSHFANWNKQTERRR